MIITSPPLTEVVPEALTVAVACPTSSATCPETLTLAEAAISISAALRESLLSAATVTVVPVMLTAPEASIEIVEAPLDEFWMRDMGPTFVVDPDRPGILGAVDWIFNGWGAPDWAEWQKSAGIARVVAEHLGAERIDSLLVAEGGGLHVDGTGTVLLTETVQLDPRRNPFADRARVEAEMARTIGATDAIWLSRGLTRDYDDLGTNGHVDIVATFASPEHVLVHEQTDATHPDFEVSRLVRRELSDAFAARGREVRITGIPAPTALRDDEGWLDWSYINHLVTNDGVVLCGFGDETADARAREIVADAYPGRRVVTVDSRPIFDRGGGIHCITQQQPALG